MTKLYLVRHGEAAATWDKDKDPALSALGKQQAEKAAEDLFNLGPISVLTSPLQRTRQTAQPFERNWKIHAMIEPAIAEIPTPNLKMEERGPWLASIMGGTWSEHGSVQAGSGTLQDWRETLIERLLKINEDILLTTHFIAINVAVGWATGDDRIISFKPDNCSCTALEISNGKLELVSLGQEAETVIG